MAHDAPATPTGDLSRSRSGLSTNSAIEVKLIGLAPCLYLRIKRFRGIREIFKESRTQPPFHVEIRGIIPVSTAFLALPIEAVLMPRKSCARKDEGEPSLSIGDVSHHEVDPSVGASDKRRPTRGSSKTHWPWCLYGAITLIAFIQDSCFQLFHGFAQ